MSSNPKEMKQVDQLLGDQQGQERSQRCYRCTQTTSAPGDSQPLEELLGSGQQAALMRPTGCENPAQPKQESQPEQWPIGRYNAVSPIGWIQQGTQQRVQIVGQVFDGEERLIRTLNKLTATEQNLPLAQG